MDFLADMSQHGKLMKNIFINQNITYSSIINVNIASYVSSYSTIMIMCNCLHV